MIPETPVSKSVLRRAARIAMAIMLATTAVVGGVAGPAYAYSWTYRDNMEVVGGNPPENRFFFESDSPYVDTLFKDLRNTSIRNFSGVSSAKLGQSFAGATWISVGQTVRV